MAKQTSQKKAVSRKGLILLASGVFSIFKISILLGLILLVLGFFMHFIFVLIGRQLKILYKVQL